MADNLTVEDAFLKAKAEVDEWFERFMRDWYDTTIASDGRALLANQPPEVQAQIKQMVPGAVDHLNNRRGGV